MDDTAEASSVTERLADFVTYGLEHRKPMLCTQEGGILGLLPGHSGTDLSCK